MSVGRPNQPHILLTELAFPESPRWHDGRLWVSDWGAGEVVATGLDGRPEVVAQAPGFRCASTTCPTAGC